LIKAKIIAAAVFATALFLSCANQSAPSGGPVDDKPPVVSASSPENGQVNVDRRARVTVGFSEWINPAGASGAVSVYPPLPNGVTVRASKNKITVAPNGIFKDNTTYHVVISAALQDLRGNAIPKPVNIVFSTGAALDSGTLDGAVVSLSPLTAIPKVALYLDGADRPDAGYFSAPDYAAQCDSAGAFSFSNLREGKYRAIAFTDPNRTGRLRPGDLCFAPPEEWITVTKTAQSIRLYPSESDTAAATARVGEKTAPDTMPLRMKSYSPAGLSSLMPDVRISWTKPARVSLSMVMASDSAGTDSVAFFFAASDGYSDTTLLAPSRRLKPGSVYRLSIPTQSIRDAQGGNAVVDGKKGRAAPKGRKPKGGPARDSLAGGDINSARIVKGVRDSLSGDNIKSDSVVKAGKDSLTGSDMSDITNDGIVKDSAADGRIVIDSLKDSVIDIPKVSAIEITIKTVAADSICYRLHGGAECLEPNDRRKWVYRPLKGGETFTTADRSGTFSFDSIPASKGTLYWFIDNDNNHALTPGKLAPWRAPERFFVVPDTVEAKARWEVEDVKVKGCE